MCEEIPVCLVQGVARRVGITHSSDRQRGLTCIVWDGKVVWDDWLGHVQALMQDPDWRLMTRFNVDLQT